MGQALGKAGWLMRSRPSGIAEAIVAILLPPACREEVLGDLYERYRSPAQYFVDTICTVPLVIASRIRRTADGQVAFMHALAVYTAFIAAARLTDGALLREQSGFLRLALPACMWVGGILLQDAYAKPGPQPLWRAPLTGLALTFLSQSALALPWRIMLYGCAISLLLSSAVRMLFPPAANQLQGANVPAFWLRREGGAPVDSDRVILILKTIVAIVMLCAGYQMFRRY